LCCPTPHPSRGMRHKKSRCEGIGASLKDGGPKAAFWPTISHEGERGRKKRKNHDVFIIQSRAAGVLRTGHGNAVSWTFSAKPACFEKLRAEKPDGQTAQYRNFKLHPGDAGRASPGLFVRDRPAPGSQHAVGSDNLIDGKTGTEFLTGLETAEASPQGLGADAPRKVIRLFHRRAPVCQRLFGHHQTDAASTAPGNVDSRTSWP